jgi:hypothetical protein
MHAQTTARFKKAFMEQLLLSLRAAGQGQASSKPTCLRERRDAVRLSSDVAMALASSARPTAAWARGLVARHAAEGRNEALMRRIMGAAAYETAAARRSGGKKEARRRRVLRRSRRVLSAGSRKRTAAAARMQVLRALVPGADGLRGSSLLTEALDYVACLKTQVELMQCLCRASRIPFLPAGRVKEVISAQGKNTSVRF